MTIAEEDAHILSDRLARFPPSTEIDWQLWLADAYRVRDRMPEDSDARKELTRYIDAARRHLAEQQPHVEWEPDRAA